MKTASTRKPFLIVGFLTALMLFSGGFSQLLACSRPPPDPGPPQFWIHPHFFPFPFFWIGTSRFLVSANGMGACVVGISLVPGMAAATSAYFLDADTMEPLAELVFKPDVGTTLFAESLAPKVGRGVPGLSGDKGWQGFSGEVRGELPEGREVVLAFAVTSDGTVTDAELVRNFNDVGQIMAGALDENGQAAEGHFEIIRPGEIMADLVLLKPGTVMGE